MGDFKSGQQSDVNSVSKHGQLMGCDSDAWEYGELFFKTYF
jgi:hypothetical protein